MMRKMVAIVLILISLLATDVTLISVRLLQAVLACMHGAEILQPGMLQTLYSIVARVIISVAFPC